MAASCALSVVATCCYQVGMVMQKIGADRMPRLGLTLRQGAVYLAFLRSPIWLGGLAVTCDVTEWADQEAMVARTLEEYGRLDVAFANAGFGAERSFKASTPEHWRAMVLTNVYGAALTIRACYDALVESQGHLLLTGSLAGRRALPGSLYSCTKFAISAMGEAAHLELNGTGVRVTLIEPGMVDTPFFDERPVGVLEADDVARAVMYAVSQPPHVDVNEILVRPTAQEV